MTLAQDQRYIFGLMCAQYTVKGPARALADHLSAHLATPLDQRVYDERVVPFHMAPVLVNRRSERYLQEMRFHLTPAWAREPKVKWATYNARLDDIETKSSFRRPFLDKHCIVVLSGFVEPIYSGDHAGHMVSFQRRDEDWLLAAGIYDEWVNPRTGEILESFSIITDAPDDFVAKVGHDRQPLFLNAHDVGTWLSVSEKDPQALRTWLRQRRAALDLVVEHDRPMRVGWEKRIPEEKANDGLSNS